MGGGGRDEFIIKSLSKKRILEQNARRTFKKPSRTSHRLTEKFISKVENRLNNGFLENSWLLEKNYSE